MSNELIKEPQKTALAPQWIAKQQETLALSKAIIESPVKITMLEMNLNMVATLNKPVLKTVFKDNSTLVFSVVRLLVNRFLNSFAFANKLSENQKDVLTSDTLENFAHESLTDIILFFKMARSGKFGTTKRGVDANLIFGEWFPMYLELKSQAREANKLAEKQSYKMDKNMKDVYISYKEAYLRNLKKEDKHYIDRFTANMDRQMLEDTITTWEKDESLKKHVPLLKKKRRTILK